jgi:hypothetical protein
MADTHPSGLGFQADTRPSERTWATLFLATPPMRVKKPPTYQPPAPSLAITPTFPSTLGMDVSTRPTVGSTTTKPPV